MWIVYLVLLFLLACFVGVLLIKFRNRVVARQEKIKEAKSRVRILKAKYLQVLRKVGTTQAFANSAQGSAYYAANRSGGGHLIGGAMGGIDSNFRDVASLVVSLADEYQLEQQNLNELVNDYNLYISAFPRVLLSLMFGYKKEAYVDSDNLSESTKLQGFDETDI